MTLPAALPIPVTPDSPITDLTAFMREYSYLAGTEVRAVLEESQAEQNAAINAQIATLTGQDTEINAFLAQIKTLLDSDTDSAGFQEGQNLYAYVVEKYALLAGSLATLRSDWGASVSAMQGAIGDLQSELGDHLSRIQSLESGLNSLRDQVIPAIQGSVTILGVNVATIANTLADTYAGLATQMNFLRAGLRGEVRPLGGGLK